MKKSLAVLIGLFAYSASLSAAVTTFVFTGNLNQNTGFDSGGTQFLLKYSYDSQTPNTCNSYTNIGCLSYAEGLTLDRFEWGGNLYNVDQASAEVIYVNNSGDQPSDVYQFQANLNGTQFGWHNLDITLHLRDSTQGVFNNTDIPATINLDDFDTDYRRLYLSGVPTGGFNNLVTSGNVTAVSNVPVPAAAWLFGSALLGLVGVKRRR